jgi:hypothetical protein
MDELIKHRRQERWNEKEITTMMRYMSPILERHNLDIDINFMKEMYIASKSITASYRSTSGKNFEKDIEYILDINDISYSRQVYIKNDIVIEKRKDANYTADIIIPKIKIGENIKDFNLISIKTTLRERHNLDNSLKFKKIYLITLDAKIPNTINKDTIIIVPEYIKNDKKHYNMEQFIKLLKN